MGAHPFIHEEGIGYSLWKQPMFWTSSVRVSLQLLCTLAAVSSDGGRRRDGAAVPGPPVQVTPRVSRALKLGRVVPSEAVLCPGATRLVLQNWVGSQGACPCCSAPSSARAVGAPLLCRDSRGVLPVLAGLGGSFRCLHQTGPASRPCVQPAASPPVLSLRSALRRAPGTCVVVVICHAAARVSPCLVIPLQRVPGAGSRVRAGVSHLQTLLPRDRRALSVPSKDFSAGSRWRDRRRVAQGTGEGMLAGVTEGGRSRPERTGGFPRGRR